MDVDVAKEYTNSVWDQFAQSIQAQFEKATSATSEFSAALLRSLNAELNPGTKTKPLLCDLIARFTQGAIDQCEAQLGVAAASSDATTEPHAPSALLALLSNCGEVVFGRADLAHVRDAPCVSHNARFVSLTLHYFLSSQRLDKLITVSTPQILKNMPSLMITYIAHRGKEKAIASAWSKVLSCLAQDENLVIQCLPQLLPAVKRGLLPDQVKLEDENVLDDMIGRLMVKALDGGSKESLEVVKEILITPCEFPLMLYTLKHSLIRSTCAQTPFCLDEHFSVSYTASYSRIRKRSDFYSVGTRRRHPLQLYARLWILSYPLSKHIRGWRYRKMFARSCMTSSFLGIYIPNLAEVKLMVA